MHTALRLVVCLVVPLLLTTNAWAASSIRFLHTPAQSTPVASDLVVSGNVFGAGEMERGYLVYRVDGGDWQRLDLVREGSDQYAATVPGDRLLGGVVEYYVEATDWFGDSYEIFASRAKPSRVPISGGTASVVPETTDVPEDEPVPEDKPLPEPVAAPVVAAPVERPANVRVWEPGGVVGGQAETFVVEEERASIASRHEQVLSEAPGVVTVMTREEIRALHVRRLADLMKFVPGFETSRDVRGFWRVAARGRRSDAEILVMLDGRRLNNPYDGRVQWELSLDDIERVEIMRGAGAMHGAGAVSAVINLVSRTDLGASAQVTGGSFGTLEGSARGGVQLGNVSIHAAAGGATRSGYAADVRRDAVTTDPDINAGVTDDHRTGFDASVRAEYRAEDSNKPVLSTSLRASRQSRGALVGLLDVVGAGSQLSWTTLQGDLGAHFDVGALKLTGRLYADTHLTDRLYMLFPEGWTANGRTYQDGVQQQTAATTWSVGGELIGEANPSDAHRLTFGVQVERQALSSFALRANVDGTTPIKELAEPTGVTFPQHDPARSSRLVAGLFLQDAWNPVPPLVLTGGLRADFVTGFGLALNPRLAVVWQVTEPVTLKLMAARAFRAPTFDEYLSIVALAPMFTGGHVQGFDETNPLGAMSVTSVESGVSLSDAFVGGRGTLRANAFFNFFQNPIEPEGAAPKLVNRELGVRVFGAEAEARYDWSANGASTFVNVSWFRARDLETNEQTPDFALLTDVPQLRGNFGLVVPLGLVGWMSLNAQFGSERRNNTRTSLEATRRYSIPAYGLFGASLRTRPLFGVVEVQASVFNLTDLAYFDDVPRPDSMPGLLPREGMHGMVTLRAAM